MGALDLAGLTALVMGLIVAFWLGVVWIGFRVQRWRNIRRRLHGKGF